MNFRGLFSIGVMALLVPSSPIRADELTRRERGDLAIRARAILKTHCFECHGGPASRGTIAVLEHSKLISTRNPVPFVAPGEAAASQIIQFLEDGSMPPGDRPRPSDEEIKTLKDWVQARAPGYPIAFDDATTLSVMLRDVGDHPDDAPYYRYFSLAHLVGQGTDLSRLKTSEFNLQKSLTWCGVKPPPGMPAAEPVDDSATLFRFDVRHAGWERGELFFRSVNQAPDDIHSLTPYDLILLEYPFASIPRAGDKPSAALADYFSKARLALPVPFLKADWVGEQLAMRTPLADDLRSLNDLAAALKAENWPPLKKEAKMPCGPKAQAFAGKNPANAAPAPSAAQPMLPLSAWYSGDCQADPSPFKLEARAIDQSGMAMKSVTRKQPFMLEVTTDRDVHFVLLMVWANGEVVIQGTNKKGFLKAGKTVLATESSKPFSIADILTGEPKATEYLILVTSPEPIPAPILVRSRHALRGGCEEKMQYPIHRFLLPAEPKFDTTRVVRRVVAITVTEK